jgi:copper(I)-binding protein
MNSKTPLSFLLVITSLFFPAYAPAAEAEAKLVIENAWIAEAPPVSKVMVAYMTLENTGPETMEITGATSTMYSSIEFHETVYEDDMAHMIRHASLIVPAHGKLELKPGGPHLMLFNPVKALKAGDAVIISFTTGDHTEEIISVTVKKAN